MYDAPGMRVTPHSRGYGVSMPFAAHAAAEPPSQLQATLVKSAKDVFAGTMGGIIVTVIGHPFDTVKVRPPARSSPPFARSATTPIADPSPRARPPRVRTRRGGVPTIHEPCVSRPPSASDDGDLRRRRRPIPRRRAHPHPPSVTLAAQVLLQTQPANNPIYSGPIDAVSKVLKSEGVGGLYKGITSPLAGQMFFRATLFFGYARAKEIVGVSPDDPLSYFKAGVLAWAAGTMFESPIDLYKSQWQSMIIKAKQTPNYVPPYKNVGECVRASIKLNGIRGPYQGLSGAMARNLPAGAIYFGVFENTKNYFASRNESGAATDLQIMAAGGFGGFCYWSLFYPVDVIKSAMMTDNIDPAKRQYKGFFDAGSQLIKQGGVRRLYAGLVPCLLRSSPANAGMLYTVDKIKQMLG